VGGERTARGGKEVTSGFEGFVLGFSVIAVVESSVAFEYLGKFSYIGLFFSSRVVGTFWAPVGIPGKASSHQQDGPMPWKM
jgi:hypothetical protein